MGWFYLADGIQLMPMVAGLFAFPEIINGLVKGSKISGKNAQMILSKHIQANPAVWQNKWDALRGGFIGAFIGFLPWLRWSYVRLDGIW